MDGHSTPILAGRYVGAPVPRREDARLLVGQGRYVDDVQLPGMLHAAFVRSDVAKGRIVSIDSTAAVALEGVVAVFAGDDVNALVSPNWHGMLGGRKGPPAALPLADGAVRFVGDCLAMVIAQSRAVAEDGCERVAVEIESETAIVDYMTPGEHDSDPGNARLFGSTRSFATAGYEQAEATSAHVADVFVEQNRYLAVPMECRGVVAQYDPFERALDVFISGQSAHGAREYFARLLKLPEASVRTRTRDVGGAFGQKMFVLREESAVVVAAKLLGKPIKWIEDRRENLVAAPHSRNECGTVRVSMSADGIYNAISIDHRTDIGAYPIVPSGMDAGLLTGPYRFAELAYNSRAVPTNTAGRGAYRAPWMFEAFSREVALDVAARRAGLDPIELRRRNILFSSEMPHTSPFGYEFDEVTPGETLERVLGAIGYDSFRQRQLDARAAGRWIGLGLSSYIEHSSKGAADLGTEGALVRIESSGAVTAYVGTSAHGQGIETTMAQLLADTLGVDIDDITIVQGDTLSTPFGPGTGGSRTAVVTGGAIATAGANVRNKAFAIAAHVLEAAVEDIEALGGVVSVKGTPSKGLTYSEIAELAYSASTGMPAELEMGLESNVRFRPTRYPTWSNATHGCIVEVDRKTCQPTIERFVVCEDCGPMINPTIVNGQTAGGVVQGIGGVLFENFAYDDSGNPLTTTFMDYLLPTTDNVPQIEIHHLQTLSTTNPGGFKGMGEGGAIGAPAAVVNAIGDALAHLGVEVTRTPLGPNDIYALIHPGEQR
ncbi:MAG: Carbon-monoxide dehydrogenase (acceptor) [Acidimicrobiales bacterium]|nr:Carbon-monoxide dehydrogenase (acceptor) [Acidimicrobiales bacterium]